MSRLEKTILFPILLGVIFLGACSNNLWDEVPTPIASFIEQYFPGSGVKEFSETDTSYRVKINNGATLVFDSEYGWTSINGNWVHLP